MGGGGDGGADGDGGGGDAGGGDDDDDDVMVMVIIGELVGLLVGGSVGWLSGERGRKTIYLNSRSTAPWRRYW